MPAAPGSRSPLRRVGAAAVGALRRSPTLADGLLAGGLAVLGAATGVVLVAPAAVGVDAPAPEVVVVWAVALAAPLLVRRRFPCTVLVVTAGHFAVYWAVGQVHEIASWLVLGVAVYSAAAYGRRPTATWCTAAGLVGTTALFSGTALANGTSVASAVVLAIGNALPYLLGWPLGHATRQVREYRALLEERHAELERSRAAETRGAVLEERVRIARELHDVLAHHVSLIGIQAGVAARLFSARPDDAREAITGVQEGSRQAIGDLQELLGVLRADDPRVAAADAPTPYEPAPGLDRLSELAATVRRTGLGVELAVEGAPRRLAPGVELSAFRIVQEALTNSMRHARAEHAWVAVRYEPGGIEIEILDDGDGPGSDPAEGRGLVGMRERTTMHGGRLEVGARPEGGFRVHAILRPS